jgi:hypothetical protein
MKGYKALIVYFLVNCTLAKAQEVKVIPRVISLPVDEQAVTIVHMAPGYTTSVRMPEEISSVVIGDPAMFKAEHSESEPRLVFLKPLTAKPAESNALITMKSGQEVSLHLLSPGTGVTGDPRVDFFVEYRRSRSLLIASTSNSFFVPETQSISPTNPEVPMAQLKPDWVAEALQRQQKLAPQWVGTELLTAVGESVEQGNQTVVGFSLVNHSKEIVELLPPQVQITGRAGNSSKLTRAEPIALSEYRMTLRRLRPGQRADGVAVFERPAFKESGEKLELRLARADQVDHPLVLAVPFIPVSRGASNE